MAEYIGIVPKKHIAQSLIKVW